MISPSAEQQIRQQAKRLGVLADRIIRHGRKAMTWTEHDEIVLTLRDGEKALLTLLASLSQELERIRTEHEDLQARSGKPDDHRDFSIHAPTDGGKS